MKYGKIKKESDNKKRSDGSILVDGELYTLKELEYYSIDKKHYDVVEVPKNKTYWCFGARFTE